MADRTNAEDFRHHLSVNAPPHPIPKDMQGSDNDIPLSPQWLLPKPGDNKLGIVTGEPHFSPHHGNRPDAVKASGNGEEFHDVEKKKDVSRPSVYDTEAGRRDCWRDEERETNSAFRRDRWREADKELGDTRRIERWSDRHSGEARRAPAERWTDSGNRESYDQRRESKWNTRWGPDDKELENRREKWSDSGRDGEGFRDKGTPPIAIHGKDIISQGKDTDREGEHYSRSWRFNSSLTRGRGETSPLTPNKQGSMFGYGRGKGENGASNFSAGRGKVHSTMSTVNSGSSRSYPLGFVPDKSDGAHGDPSTVRYSRMKLLDIYRTTDIKFHMMSLEEFIEVPSLTLPEPLEPLALSSPTSEELVILKGIDKGDVVSSSLPQVSKDGSIGRNSSDSVTLKQTKLGNREDSTSTVGDYKDESTDNIKSDQFSYLGGPSYEKYLHPHGSDSKVPLSQNLQSYQGNILTVEASRSEGTLKKAGEVGMTDVSMLESSSLHDTPPWRSQSAGERSHGSSHNWQDFSTESRSRTSDVGWSHLQENEQKKSTTVSSSFFRDESHWHNIEDSRSKLKKDSKFKRQSSGLLDQEREGIVLHGLEDPFISTDKSSTRKFQPYLLPEDLTLYYKDPQGRIQGPFSGSDLIGWFETGYFGIDLQVRLASAPADAPFSLLGDVMPHLRAKARPPPGFGVARQNDVVEVSSMGKFGSLGNAHAGIGEFEPTMNGPRNRHEAATDAENRFLESLMSGNMNSSSSEHYSFAEGMQGHGGSNSGSRPSLGGESMSDMNYLLAQRMSLERQRSLPTPLPYWPGRDPSSIGSKADIIHESPTPHSKYLPPMGDASHQIPQSLQHVDLLSVLQAAADKSPSPAVNSAVPVWPNFPEARSLNNTVHGGMDIIKDKIDMHHNQHINSQTGFGVQHQRLHPQNQPSLSHILTQPGDLFSGLIPPEKLLASEVSQDPQTLSLLQQQYLLSQLQLNSQSPVPTQLTLLDKILLLQQQQLKQEQLQQQLLMQQQQHLLSQVLSGHQSHQHFGEPPFGHLKAAVPTGNSSVDHRGLHQMHEHEELQINQQMPVLNSLDGHSSNLSNFTLQGSQDVSYTVSTGPSPPLLPLQMFDHTPNSKEWDATLSQDVETIPNSDPKPIFAMADSSLLSEATEKTAQEAFVAQNNVPDLDNCVKQHKSPAISQTSKNMTSIASEAIDSLVFSEEGRGTSDIISSVSEQVDDLKVSPERIPEQCHTEAPAVKGIKEVEVREVKKASEKKSRKQKNSKTQPASEPGKGSSKTVVNQQSKLDLEIDGTNIGGRKSELHTEAEESLYGTLPLKTGLENSVVSAAVSLDSQQAPLSSSVNISAHEVEILEGKAEQGEVRTLALNSQTTSSHRAWKPAPGLKAKSLLEIQQEEQHRAQTETMASETSAMVIPTNSSPPPWVGVVAKLDHKSGKDIAQGSTSAQFVLGNSGNPLTSKSRKSQLHDLLAEEVLSKSKEGDTNILTSNENGSSLPPLPQVGAQVDISPVVDDDFVEARDTKKGRKKAAKAKAAGLKASPPVTSAYLSSPPVSTEKSKSTRQAQQEKELLPVTPAGPSLGDFVIWKGDQANSISAPAWSTDSAKLQKPTSLRDIQKEQEKKAPPVQQQTPIATPAKAQSNRVNRGSGSSWQVTGSSPSKAPSPLQTKAASPIQSSPLTSSQSKPIIEDDLFWGPLDQSKQETKQSDFPLGANTSSWGAKGTSVKGAPGVASTRQKPSSCRPAESAITSSTATVQFLSKGRRDATSKQSEAMDFREWCESELVKLTGTNDTSFLEFCLKQSTSEAEMLLRENLSSLDRNHEFIDKFLNYKDFLSPEVIEMAFRAQISRKGSGDGLSSNDTGTIRDPDAGGGGKKKGKKGKKVSPAVLGFNVVSNRIMMGEIQTIED